MLEVSGFQVSLVNTACDTFSGPYIVEIGYFLKTEYEVKSFNFERDRYVNECILALTTRAEQKRNNHEDN